MSLEMNYLDENGRVNPDAHGFLEEISISRKGDYATVLVMWYISEAAKNANLKPVGIDQIHFGTMVHGFPMEVPISEVIGPDATNADGENHEKAIYEYLHTMSKYSKAKAV